MEDYKNNTKDRIISYSGDDFGIRETQNLLLRLLEKFDIHCKKYQIKYSLAYGSMLGCVRNHGVIPWDDDVDVVMDRGNYDRFFESLKNGDTELSKNDCVETPLFLSKLHEKTVDNHNAYIDIYPADNVPDNQVLSMIKLLKIQFVKELIKGRCNHFSGLIHFVRKVFAYALSFPFTVETLRLFFTKLCTSDNNRPTKRKGSYCTGHKSMGKYYPSEFYSDMIWMDFEDIQMPVMKGYDTYLTKEYGKDYMIPPKKKDRHPTHS